MDRNKWYLRGALTAKVNARDDNTGKFISFNVDFEVSEDTDNYDFVVGLEDAVYALTELRKANKPEIVDILKRED